MTNRYKDALMISDGACNPSGIALAIVEACREMRAEPGHTGTQQICDDPAIRLMVSQLSFICGNPEMPYDQWDRARENCRITIEQEVERSPIGRSEDGGDK